MDSKTDAPNPFLKKQMHEAFTDEAIEKCGDLIEDYMNCTRKYFLNSGADCFIERSHYLRCTMRTRYQGRKPYFELPHEVAIEYEQALQDWKTRAETGQQE